MNCFFSDRVFRTAPLLSWLNTDLYMGPRATCFLSLVTGELAGDDANLRPNNAKPNLGLVRRASSPKFRALAYILLVKIIWRSGCPLPSLRHVNYRYTRDTRL